MTYTASLDKTAKIISIFSIILLGSIAVYSVISLISHDLNTISLIVQGLVLIMMIFMLVICYLYAPKSYALDKPDLLIHRPIGVIRIDTAIMTECCFLDQTELKGAIRTFGVGGLFGYFGKFSIPKIGNTTVYATQMKNCILIKTSEGKNFMISPDDVRMAEEIKRMMTLGD